MPMMLQYCVCCRIMGRCLRTVSAEVAQADNSCIGANRIRDGRSTASRCRSTCLSRRNHVCLTGRKGSEPSSVHGMWAVPLILPRSGAAPVTVIPIIDSVAAAVCMIECVSGCAAWNIKYLTHPYTLAPLINTGFNNLVRPQGRKTAPRFITV